MKKQSSGILLYRCMEGEWQVLLVHPGGPFWKNKDEGVWTIPKGEFDDTEEPLAAAIREFKEETGLNLKGDFISLHSIRQKSGKTVYAWALEGDADTTKIISNTFEIEWPPKSGKYQSFPEIDTAAWYSIAEAKKKLNPAQIVFLNELMELIH